MDKSHKINGKVATIRDWSDIPSDILSSIGDRLGLIELLSFRSACKDWRSSSSSASACIESFPNHKPWFLLYGENSQCLLYNQSNERYTMDIPELQGGATCIASKHGWLLLFQEGMIFFFCPFSRAKIGLPQFPCSELSDHVAAFSSPPTSEDCIVSVIHRIDDHKLEVNVIHRGDNTWTNHTMNFSQQVVDTITCAITSHLPDHTNEEASGSSFMSHVLVGKPDAV
ncbi:hypothetical protein L1049_004404 [Liquidambar formosana]|uniref:F-box domain-containing protein n=1 Tax=Liquidambar formosana TaxID=63359 RepID=A0AAP0WY95_LIQFO